MTFPQTITATEANKETPISEMFVGLAWAALFSHNPDTTSGLTFGLNGGPMMVDGVLTVIADQTTLLAASSTNYVECTRAGVVSDNATGFTAGRLPLYVVTTSASGVSSFVDWRAWHDLPGVCGRLSLSVAGGINVTLTAAQARNCILNFTGLLTGNINVIVPDGPQRWIVSNNTTGAFSLTVKTTAGTGQLITQGSSSDIFADGTNVIAHSAVAGATSAAAVAIADGGGYYTGTDVEAALQEIGASLAGAVANIPAQRYTIELLDTADTDPGVGLVKFNNATPASATFLYIDDSTSDGVDLSTYFASLGATGYVKVQSVADAGEWAIFRWTAVTDGTGYFKFAVTAQASKGTLDDADAVLILFDSDANTGSGGTEIKGLTFTSDTGSTADSDPGAGLFKWNHATQASATKLFFDNATLDSITITAFFATLGTNGQVFLQQSDDASKWQLWEIDSVTADTGYYDMAVTLLALGAAIDDNKTVYCDFKAGPGSGGGTQGKHEVTFDAGGIIPSTNSPCDSLVRLSMGASNPDISYLSFDFTTAQRAEWSWVPPKSWNASTVTFCYDWSHAAATVNFGVAYQLEAVAVSDGDTQIATWGSAVIQTDTGGNTSYRYRSAESSAVTIGGTPAKGDRVFFRLTRVTTDAGDTLQVGGRLQGVTIYFTTDADTDA